PAVEFEVRSLMALLYMGDGPSLLDAAACFQQVKRTNELLARIPDSQLPFPRDLARVGASRAYLWAGYTQEGRAQFRALREEFLHRVPPAGRYAAFCLAAEAHWHLWKGEAALAEAQLTEALRLFNSDPPPQDIYFIGYFIRGYLAQALLDREAWD